MAGVISITKILGTVHDGTVEVCASADADYDSAAEKVTVALGSFTRSVSGSGDGHHEAEPWLPGDERVSEHLSRDEADDFARDVFENWVKRVRASVPRDLMLRV